MADQYATEVLQPGEEALHFPPACVPPPRTAILCLGVLAIGPRRSHRLDAWLGQARSERVALSGLVADQMLRSSLDHARGKSGLNMGDFMRRSSRNEEPLEDAGADPGLEAAMSGLIGRIAWGHILLWCPSPQEPEHAVQGGPRIAPRAASAILAAWRSWKEPLEHFPWLVREIHQRHPPPSPVRGYLSTH